MYAKVFAQIFDSSIADDYQLRHFFMDLLVLADPNGVVDMTATAIAARIRLPLPDVLIHLSKLEAPDAESRTADADGRRIERMDEHRSWGWHIINYSAFREIASEEQRREKTRVRVARFKLRRKQLGEGNASVTLGNADNAMQKQRKKYKQKQMERDKTTKGVVVPARKELAAAALVSSAIQNEVNDVTTGKAATITEPTREAIAELPSHLQTARMQNKWQVWQNVRKGFKAPKSWLTLFNEQIEWFSKFDEPTAFEILSASIRNGWQGLFEPKGTNAKTNTQPRNSGHGGNSTTPDYSKGF